MIKGNAMKKLAFGLIGLVLIAVIYYFMNGSAQITQEAKQELNHALSTLQQSGFSVNARKSTQKTDHFIIRFDEPEKITRYLNKQGVEMTLEEAKALKGLQVGVETQYLPDRSTALSLNLYPVALPDQMMKDLSHEDKQLADHIRGMLDKRALLLHIDFNKMLSGFKGYVKDINETIEEDGEKVKVAAKGMTFEGNFKAGRIHEFSQKAALVSLDADKELQLKISGIEGRYTATGTSPYDISSHYHAKTVAITSGQTLSVLAQNVDNTTQNSVHNGLLKSVIRSKAESIEISEAQKKHTIHTMLFDFTANNLDIAAIEALQKTDPKDKTRISQLTQQMLSKGITFTLNTLSAKKITENGSTIDGFDINGTVSIAKSFNINAASQNPLLVLDAIDIKTYISVSDALYALTVQDPRAMIMMMMVPPVEKAGRKIYTVIFSHGKLTVNGTSF